MIFHDVEVADKRARSVYVVRFFRLEGALLLLHRLVSESLPVRSCESSSLDNDPLVTHHIVHLRSCYYSSWHHVRHLVTS